MEETITDPLDKVFAEPSSISNLKLAPKNEENITTKEKKTKTDYVPVEDVEEFIQHGNISKKNRKSKLTILNFRIDQNSDHSNNQRNRQTIQNC
jgi:hypothetical protein